MQPVIQKHFDILACSVCRGQLSGDDGGLNCNQCGASYAFHNEIPLLFAPSNGQPNDVTGVVKNFYEENPFPNYDDLDNAQSLMDKARQGVFARLLDEQLPHGAVVLEAGCGTGQLTNFLGLHWNRSVFGSDMCLNSLRLAKGFRDSCHIKNAGFLQMNLFRPAFRDGVFDVVVSMGVLHHTGDPLGGFRSISRLVKPGGHIIIGLYNKIGRLTTDFRRRVFQFTGDRLKFLDEHVRNKRYNEARKRAWFMDQYKNPHESKHSYDEVLEWFGSTGYEFLMAIPKIDAKAFSADEQLFTPHDKGTKSTRFLTQLEMLLQGGVDGALFIMIGRKGTGQTAEAEMRVQEATGVR